MKEFIIHLPTRESEAVLNPSIILHNDGYLLAYRKDYLDEALLHRKARVNAAQYWGLWKNINFSFLGFDFTPKEIEFSHFEGEDPRIFRAMDKIWCSYATSPRSWRWWCVEVISDKCKLGEPFLPDYLTNRYIIGGPEKNWTWIDGADYLDCIYSFNPYVVLRFDGTGNRLEQQTLNCSVSWHYGPVRGGSPAVLLPSGERFAVFHSFLSGGRYNRTYLAGGIYMEPEWPYRPIRILTKPILFGRRRFKRWPWLDCIHPRTRVCYPCGLIALKDKLLVSYGIDDCACAIAEFSYTELFNFGSTNIL